MCYYLLHSATKKKIAFALISVPKSKVQIMCVQHCFDNYIVTMHFALKTEDVNFVMLSSNIRWNNSSSTNFWLHMKVHEHTENISESKLIKVDHQNMTRAAKHIFNNPSHVVTLQ